MHFTDTAIYDPGNMAQVPVKTKKSLSGPVAGATETENGWMHFEQWTGAARNTSLHQRYS
jgi:hypothetical protein